MAGYDPCNPEEINRIAETLSKKKHREISIEDIDENAPVEEFPSTSAEAVARKRLGILGRYRVAEGLFGKEFTAKVLNKVVMADTKANNFIGKKTKEFNDAIKPLVSFIQKKFAVVPVELDKEMLTIMEKIGKGGKILDPIVLKTHSAEKIEAAKKVRKIFDESFNELMLDPDTFIQGYVPLIKARGGNGIFINNPNPTPLENAFTSRLTSKQVKFMHELERTGWFTDPEPKLSTVFGAYMHAAANAKIRKPVIEQVTRDHVLPFFNAKLVESPLSGQKRLMVNSKVGWNTWKEYVHTVYGGLQEADRRWADNMSKVSEWFGYPPINSRGPYTLSHIMTSAMYMGTMGSPLGGRPSSVIKQFFQLVPTFAEFGPRYTRMALRDVINDITSGSKALFTEYRDRGLMTSHLESLIQSTDASRGIGKAVSTASDTFLRWFAAADAFGRAATVRAADLRFNEYLQRMDIGSLPGLKAVREEVIDLIKKGDINGARDLYALDAVRHLQYIYGNANKPEFMRGALGNLTGVFMSYPLNTAEMMKYFFDRAKEGIAEKGWKAAKDDWFPMIRLVGTTGALVQLGSEYLDADLRSSFWIGGLPNSIAFPKMAADTWKAGETTVDWLSGNVFNIDESAYAKHERKQAWEDVKRHALTLGIPGYGFVSDLSKVIDQGDVTLALGRTPGGRELDTQRALRRKLQRTIESGGE